jgi:hypothetical protein
MLKRLNELEPALALLSADNVSISRIYPDDDDIIAIKVKWHH